MASGENRGKIGVRDKIWSERAARTQGELLASIARGHSLGACLAEIATAITKLHPGTCARVLLPDEARELTAGTGGVSLGSEPVTCGDLASDARWSPAWRHACAARGVLAFHLEPAPGPGGAPLGWFLLDFAMPRGPTDQERQSARFGADLAAIAIQRATSEERFRGVFDSRLMGLTIFDANTRETLEINDCFLEMTGHSRSDFEAGRWDWRVFTLPEYLPLDEAAIAQARERGWWDPYEKEYRRRDGSRFPVRIGSAPFADQFGRVIVCVQDISATWAAQNELRESEQRLQLAKQAAGIAVWDWDLATQAITWSPDMFEVLGIDPATPSESRYQAWVEMVHPDDRDRCNDAARLSAETGVPLAEDFRVVRRDGEVRWIRTQGMVLRDAEGRPARMTGINVDVTAQHREEERLRRTAESLAAQVEERTRERNRIFELSADLFAVMGYDGYMRVVNPAWTRLLGFAEDEVLARPLSVAIHPDDQTKAIWALDELRAGRTVQGFEDRLLRKDGEIVWISWTCVPGDEDVFYAVGRDVTREKEREEALRQAQKMEAVGQLTGGIAHDFNNLLGAVMGGFDLIRRKPGDPDRVRRIADHGLAAAERGAKLTAQLLAFSRAQKVEQKPVLVADLVDGMKDLLARTLGPQVRLVFDLDRARVPVLSDPVQLEMAILNLAINARDAMPDGGDLIISTAVRTVPGDAELVAGEYVELAVRDTGTGITSEVAKRAFDPFFTTKGVGKGTGLGLSQVYGIARQAGGAARIESAPGRGTTVRLLLPRTDGALARSSASVTEHAPPVTAKVTVLVIDDDDDLRRMLAESLDSLGYSVIAVDGGPSALAVLAEHEPDLVLLDFAMPGMSGAEVAEGIRTIRPTLPIVFVSGYANTDAIERAAGARTTVLRKPFRIDELQLVVADTLKGRR
jgi:PAS domain S-box-containing protein